MYSAATFEEFALWKAYDDAQDNFCVMNEEDTGAEYVDLLLNPERYTGYKGKSAHRIWNSIYLENCFRYFDLLKCDSVKTVCQTKEYGILSHLCFYITFHNANIPTLELLCPSPLPRIELG